MKINEILLEKLLSKLSKTFVLILEQTKIIPKFEKLKKKFVSLEESNL